MAGHNRPVPARLPFLPDIHEVETFWKKPYIVSFNTFDVEEMHKYGYASTSPIEDMFVNFLSVGETLKLKTPILPSKPLRTSKLNDRTHAAAGQAVGALHMMAVLQAY